MKRIVWCCLLVMGLTGESRFLAGPELWAQSVQRPAHVENPLRRLDPPPAVPPAAPPTEPAPLAPAALPSLAPVPRAVPAGDVPASEPAAGAGAGAATATAAELAPSATGLTLERVAELMRQTREAAGIADELKADLLKRYQAATDLLQSVEEAKRKAAQYEQEIQQGAATIEAARQELAKSPSDPTLQSYRDKTLAELETLLNQSEGRLAEARARLSDREAELKNRAERRSELAKKTEETKQRLAEAEKELSLPAPQNEPSEMTAARHTEIEARQQALRATLELYQAEVKRSDKLADFFPLQRDLVKRETNQLEREVAHFQSLVDKARKLESERQAREARLQAELADPALRDLAEHNATLAETRKKIAEKVTQVSAEVKEVGQQLGRLSDDFNGAKNKVDKAGHSSTVGLLLRRKRDVLPSATRCQQRLRFIQKEMPVVNLQRLELEEDRTALGDIEAAQQQVMSNLDEQLTRMHGEHLPLTVRELLSTKRDLLDRLISDLDTYLFALGELETNHRDLIKTSDEFRDFIDEHVLWIRSADRLGTATLSQITHGVLSAARPQQWLRLATNSGLDTLRQPWMAAGVLAAVLLLLRFQARLRQRIRDLCENRANSQGLRFLPVMRALLLTAVVTAGWPVLVGYVGWRMTSSEQISELGMAVGPALRYAAGIFWLVGFIRSLCRPDGVAETYFNWPRSGLKLARQALHWLVWCGVPLTSVVIAAQLYRQGEWADSIGRVAFVLVMFVLIGFTQAVLGKKNNVFREAIAKDPKNWLNHTRIVAYAAGTIVPFTLAVLAVVGYYYSAQHLAIRLQATLAMGLVSLLIHAVASRWFVVKRRRLAMAQARERQQAAQEEPADGTSGAVGGIVPVQVNDAPDWAAVHDKLRLLLRQAITVGVFVASWFIWSDVLPALKILDNVELWSKTVEVSERFEGADGNVQHVRNLEVSRTTLRHGLIAAMILLATFVLGRNLPALLEITVLNRLPLDRGGRHAVSIISHYTVALSGVFVALRTLSINWASVQWLAAGITVGLGFGLQEIFANFVSGMILLFERPIRVGDIITLGDVTGTVTNIRIRATTVTNWDRKELIVPNKDLVTGRLLNWTLSDTTNRIVINVGLAYDSDVNHARQVMERVVVGHPNVLADPAPAVTFEGFGDSTLSFVIRAYLASLDVRLATIHELHVGLHHALQKEGIEIAFPQRDINIRHISVAAQTLLPERGSRRSDAA